MLDAGETTDRRPLRHRPVDQFLDVDMGVNASKAEVKQFAKDTAKKSLSGFAAFDQAFTKRVDAAASALLPGSGLIADPVRSGVERIKNMKIGGTALRDMPGAAGSSAAGWAKNKENQFIKSNMNRDQYKAYSSNKRYAKRQMNLAAPKVKSGAKFARNFVGLNVAFAGAFTAMEYASDPKANHFGSKFAANTVGFMADEAVGYGLGLAAKGAGWGAKQVGFARMGAMMMARSTPIGLAATIAVHAAGAGASALIGAHHDSTMGKLDSIKRGGKRNIEQNERTMQATQSQMALLGQTGNYSMLGNEAQMMHT